MANPIYEEELPRTVSDEVPAFPNMYKGGLTNFAHPIYSTEHFLYERKISAHFFSIIHMYTLRFANIFLHLLPVFFTAKKEMHPHSALCYFHLPQRKKEPYTH